MQRRLVALFLTLMLALALVPNGAGAFSDRWGQLTPTAGNSALLDITYGGSTWVAVGKLGAVVISTDGVAWTPGNSATEEDLLAVAYGNGRYVAVGKQPVLSENGTDWRTVSISPTGTTTSVIFAAGKFTAVDDKGQVFDSTDGSTWTLLKSFARPFEPAPQLVSLTYANGLYSAIDGGGRPFHFGARDHQWTQGWGSTCSRILYLGGQYLKLCEGFVVTGTPDARRFDRRDSATYVLLRDAVHDGQRYLAVGDSGAMVTSANGIEWTELEKPRIAPDYYALEYAAGLYVLAGDHASIWTSRDGRAWTRRYSGVDTDLAAVVGTAERWVAVGSDGAIFTSPQPWPWRWTRRRSGTQQDLRSVVAGAGLFVAVGAGGTVITSPDGKTWSPQPSGTEADLKAVLFAGDRFVAAGQSAAGKAVVLSSSDGRTWKVHQIDLPGFRALAFSGERFVAVGAGGLIATSSDGATWTRVTSPVQGDLHGVAYGDGRFLAVGGSAGLGLALVSTDGSTWTRVDGAGSEPLFGVAFGTDRFFVTGSQGTAGYYAGDGPLVVTPNSIVGEMRGIALYGTRLIAVGGAGAIRFWHLPSSERSAVRVSAEQVKAGEEFTVTAVVTDEWGMTRSGRTVRLEHDATLVAVEDLSPTTTYKGEAQFKVKALRSGTATLTAIADDGTRLGQPVAITITASCGLRFSDVPTGHPNCAAIERLAELKVIGGYNNLFEPERGLTRAELATMLVRALKLAPAPGESLAFSDTAGHWAARDGFIQAAVKAGAFSGMPDGTFQPDGPVTRAQLVKVVAAAAKLKTGGSVPYPDIAATDWYAWWVGAASQAGLIGPKAAHPVFTGREFQGDRPATRAEAAAMLANLLAR